MNWTKNRWLNNSKNEVSKRNLPNQIIGHKKNNLHLKLIFNLPIKGKLLTKVRLNTLQFPINILFKPWFVLLDYRPEGATFGDLTYPQKWFYIINVV